MKRVPPPFATESSRRLRSNPTEAEKRLWLLLREAFPEARFRRQVPIRQYVVDFASHRAKLVIEADGGQHDAVSDADRTAVIGADGYRVLRFWNNDILSSPDGVAQVIGEILATRSIAFARTSPPPNPPPSRGRAIAGGDDAFETRRSEGAS